MNLAVIGVPTSAGAFAPGQEQAPGALRAAGLLQVLRASGVQLRDDGDRDPWRWRPDRTHPRAQNVEMIVDIVRDTATRVRHARERSELTLVLGGDCTVGIGTVAGHADRAERIGVIYFDTHADLNVPDSVREGALDWMGMAHMLGVPGAVPELTAVGPREPLLDPDQVVLFGWGSEQATACERDAIARLGLNVVGVTEVAADPEGAAARAVALLGKRCERLLVHFDVDVIDFTDVPLSENVGRNEGLPYRITIRALTSLLGSASLVGLTITELNPDHAEHGARSIERFASDVAHSLARSPALG